MPTQKILVIDDDETILGIVEAVLKNYDFNSVSANNGEKGLELAISESPDVILLDRKMPGLSGNDILKELKKNPETQHIPVVMLTGDNNITEVTKSLELGAQDYIVKPFNNENLVVRVKNVLQR